MQKNKSNKILLSLLTLAFSGYVGISTQPAMARVNVDELRDLRTDHWAYNAIRDLVDKYDVMSGFPDGNFKGSRNFTRYEAAAALYKVLVRVEEMMGNRVPQPVINNTPSKNSTVSSEDLKLIKDLSDEFKRELDAMRAENAANFAKIKSVEEKLEKIQKDIGKVKFGGWFDAGLNDTLEDSFRPGYSSSYSFNMNANVAESTTVNASFDGSFNSEVKEQEEGGVKKKKDVEESAIGFGSAWFSYSPTNTPFNPKVKAGYMSLGSLISAGTRVPQYYGGSAGNGSANVNRGRNRGLRIVQSVVGGVDFGNGPFSVTIAGTPNTLATQAKLDLGALKLKLLADADQTLFFGEYVQDPISNQAVVVDLLNDNFGVSAQANFRSVADNWQMRAASGLLYLKVANFELGGTAKFENEASQQIVAGGFLKTPDAFGDLTVPTLVLSLQEPLTLLNGSIYEGSNLGDKAGYNISLTYDNPFLPGLSIYFDQKTNILFSTDPKDIISTSYGASISTGF
jgi:hypothetical protein